MGLAVSLVGLVLALTAGGFVAAAFAAIRPALRPWPLYRRRDYLPPMPLWVAAIILAGTLGHFTVLIVRLLT